MGQQFERATMYAVSAGKTHSCWRTSCKWGERRRSETCGCGRQGMLERREVV